MFFYSSHSAMRGPTPFTNFTSVARSSTDMMILEGRTPPQRTQRSQRSEIRRESLVEEPSLNTRRYPLADLRLATRSFGFDAPCSALKNCGRLKWSILKVNPLVHDGQDVSCTPSFTWLGSTSNERRHLGQVTMICPEPFNAIQMGEVLRLPGTGRSGALRTSSFTVPSRSGME